MARTKTKPVGAPTKLTPELHAQVVQFVRAGNYLETAAGAVGVASSTLRDILRRGARDLDAGKATKEAAFAKDTREALSLSEGLLVAKIAKDKDWRASAFLLERKFPLKYGPRQKVDIEIDGVNPERLAMLAGLLQAKGSDEE